MSGTVFGLSFVVCAASGHIILDYSRIYSNGLTILREKLLPAILKCNENFRLRGNCLALIFNLLNVDRLENASSDI